MKLELNSAANFLVHLIRLGRRNIGEQQLDNFRTAVVEVLRRRYRDHWFPEKPFKGSGYRCIRINGKLDPVIAQAAESCGLASNLVHQTFPSELTMWIDPLEVSYRIGENGSVCVLYEFKESGSNEVWKPNSSTTCTTSTTSSTSSTTAGSGSGSGGSSKVDNGGHSNAKTSSSTPASPVYHHHHHHSHPAHQPSSPSSNHHQLHPAHQVNQQQQARFSNNVNSMMNINNLNNQLANVVLTLHGDQQPSSGSQSPNNQQKSDSSSSSPNQQQPSSAVQLLHQQQQNTSSRKEQPSSPSSQQGALHCSKDSLYKIDYLMDPRKSVSIEQLAAYVSS